jgi:membrane protein DedA with SNARE-associated domain
MFHQLIHMWFSWVQDWGYFGVIVLMAMESSIFPVPSEVVMPPAAFLAAQGKMNIWLVILAGTFGSWLGSAITYWVSRWLGHAVIKKWGKYLLISEEKLKRAEHFAQRYEAGGIFFARLLPVVRHLISIPAGILEMRFGIFSTMTIIGSAIWCSILAWYGHGLAERAPDLMTDPDKLIHIIKQESLWLVGGIAVVGALYFVMLKMTAKKNDAAEG